VAPAIPTVAHQFSIKNLHLSWDLVPGATSYRLMRDPDGLSGFTQWGGTLSANSVSTNAELSVHLLDWLNARFRLEACNDAGCTPSTTFFASPGSQHDSTGYFKAANTGSGDLFGNAAALSADGKTLAVAALREDSGSNDGADDSSASAGAVYVFRIGSDGLWSAEGYLKAAHPGAGDHFGTSLDLSSDGDTLVVGASTEDSAAVGIDGNDLDDSADNAGAAFVFTRAGTVWSQQAYLKASNAEAGDNFGVEVAIDGTGNLIAVGASFEDSSADGIGGGQNTNLAESAGAVYLFARAADGWSQSAYVKGSHSGSGQHFGAALALSKDGLALVVGAPGEGSGATGIDGPQTNNTRPGSGAAYLFRLHTDGWQQEAYLKASRAVAGIAFGTSLAIDADGSTIAVGAPAESSSGTGVEGNQDDSSADSAGAVYVFDQGPGGWTQRNYLKASNTDAGDLFGYRLALNDDGTLLAVGAPSEASIAAGIGGEQADNSLTGAGAVYLFALGQAQWNQRAYLKASPSGTGHHFGRSVAFNADGSTLAVGTNDDSGAVGLGKGGIIFDRPDDNTAAQAGSVYLY
jgi:glucose/arabinose dehydrogenase